MTHVTCRLTAKNRDQLRNPTLGNRVWATFASLMPDSHRPLRLTTKLSRRVVSSRVGRCELGITLRRSFVPYKQTPAAVSVAENYNGTSSFRLTFEMSQ